MLAQLQSVPWPAVGTWLMGLVGALAVLILLLTAVGHVKKLFSKDPPLDQVVRALEEKLGDFRDELKLDGTKRSKTLFEHIDKSTETMVNRLNQHGERISRLEERTEKLRGNHGKPS